MMPNAHNGYYDTMLEMGYIGYVLLITFIISTFHAIGRVVDLDPARAWLMLSLALYVIFWNYLESLWMRGFEFLWVVFLIVAADIGRYWVGFRSDHRSKHRHRLEPINLRRRLPLRSDYHRCNLGYLIE
jgi:O-antigen ligase